MYSFTDAIITSFKLILGNLFKYKNKQKPLS